MSAYILEYIIVNCQPVWKATIVSTYMIKHTWIKVNVYDDDDDDDDDDDWVENICDKVHDGILTTQERKIARGRSRTGSLKQSIYLY